jgi:glycosyltransferase involved in cell wall biosynthesis
MRQVVVMVTSSYPRFPGDGVGSFMEPIAKGVAARGHEVHVVAPWHPAITRARTEDGVSFHFFRYAPTPGWSVFGYAGGLEGDTRVRPATWAVTPAALASGWFKAWRVATKRRATVLHGHWLIPGGWIARRAAGGRPLVVSLHGSDVYLAERHRAIGRVAAGVLRHAGWVTACSHDLRDRAIGLGADRGRIETVPYGVDTARFAPSPTARAEARRTWRLGDGPVVLAAGRLVAKKGFEYLIDAAADLQRDWPALRLVIAGEGDLRPDLAARAARVGPAPVLLGAQPQEAIARLAAAADVIAVPSIRDDAGNVDGLPNFALEALASGTPVVATRAGGLPSVIDDGRTGRLVRERDVAALAGAIADLLRHPSRASELGSAARAHVMRHFGWPRLAERLEAAYDAAGARRP